MSRKDRFTAPLLCSLLLIMSGPMTVVAGTEIIVLRWTAPGDDGFDGRATRYDIRYSTRPLTAATFNSAKAAPAMPAPKPAGSMEACILGGLASDSIYYIAMKTVDEAGNWSAMSNVVVYRAKVLAVEGAALSPAFTEPSPNPARSSVRLSFRLPQAAAIQVDVYDISSRRIRSLKDGWHDAGAVPVSWDLRDDQGQRVSPGAYLILGSTLGSRWTRRVVVID